ncbi:Delta(8)-fatty-acid desaturase [Vitis vinifera]|uniref:Delta(8)-fatty-acid desaturase n=1 Tax=Vitis vinifera TaxID=29760 RepID=A0A438GIT5_VITVI|nr:Delta(8)-fatty-acid desaturase [Vitis vinifera]
MGVFWLGHLRWTLACLLQHEFDNERHTVSKLIGSPPGYKYTNIAALLEDYVAINPIKQLLHVSSKVTKSATKKQNYELKSSHSQKYYLKDFKVSGVSKDFRKLADEFSKLGLFEKKGHGILYIYSIIGFLFMSSYVGHDSGHYQIMSSPGFNKLTQILVENCITGISFAWWKWTHNAHHIACNSLDYESDLQHIPMFTVSSNLFNSIKSIFCGRILKFNYVARFLFQLEHHLFPQLPRCHLRSISSLVKDLCKKHNLPYRGLSLREANVSTIRTLRTAALQARDLTNLVPKNLVWEAANIHG